MNTQNFFLDRPEVRDYNLQGHKISLDLYPDVFPPSAFVVPFAQNIQIKKGDKVADIGTGSGILAVMAAKQGAEVWATDTSEASVMNAKKNAQKNHVDIQAFTGSFFGPLQGKFDVIIANLPQEILPEDYKFNLGEDLSQTINGGKQGNEILMEFLKIAPQHMHKNSKLYINVGSLSDFKSTFQLIGQNYDARMINSYALPNKTFVEKNIEFYKQLNADGKVHIFREEGVWKAMVYPFELRLKNI
jgi:release factor glutamine methyltransferase